MTYNPLSYEATILGLILPDHLKPDDKGTYVFISDDSVRYTTLNSGGIYRAPAETYGMHEYGNATRFEVDRTNLYKYEEIENELVRVHVYRGIHNTYYYGFTLIHHEMG